MKLNIVRIHLIIIGLLFFNLSYAQKRINDYNFVTIKEGVSKTAIATIIQDQYGFIWMGTNGAGLNRFDGIEYTTYKHQINDTTSLSSSLIFCSYLDKKKQLWIGTEDGLNLYNRNLDIFSRVPFYKPNKLKDKSVSVGSLIEDVNGNLLIGAYEKGLFKLNVKDKSYKKIPFLVKKKDVAFISINGLQKAENGKIFAGTSLGLKEFDNTTSTLKTSTFLTEKGLISINEPIQSILIDKKGNFWLGTLTNGLIKIGLNEKLKEEVYDIQYFPFTKKRILSILQVSADTFLFGTENDGLFQLNSNGKVVKNYVNNKVDKNSIHSNSIWSLLLDKEGRVWVGSYSSGAAKYDKLYDKFKDIESLPEDLNSLEVGSVTSIIKDTQGKFWIGMDGGGIDIYDPKTNHFQKVNSRTNNYLSGLINDEIQTIFNDSKGNIWAGSWSNGLFVLKKGAKKFINYNQENSGDSFRSNSIISFSEDKEGIIWIASFYGGLHSYNPTTNKFQNYAGKPFSNFELQNSAIRKVLVDTDNNIWIGSTEGLFKVTKKSTGSFEIKSMVSKMFGNQLNETSANHILTLFQDSKGILWIGTRGAGLCKYNVKEDKISWYNKSTNLKEENVSSIIESNDGTIWVSGNNGLSKIDTKTNAITNYTSDDGLLSNDFNLNAVYKDEKGMLYFGNYKGINYFNPNEILVNKNVPSIYLTDFKLFNKQIKPNQENSPLKEVISETKEITLAHNQSVFSIEFIGINYTRPEKNQYAYYLEGFEKDWNYVGNTRTATYTNLRQGEYIFKIKAANNDGVWNETPLELKITILPPWWKTNWALFFYVIFLFISLYFFNLMMQSRMKEKQLIDAEREKRSQEEELNEKKLQFFTNISHEFRTPLTLIINPIEDIINNTKLNLPANINEKHHIIHKNADRLSKLINELMDFRKLELNKARVRASKIELLSFVKDLAAYFNEESLNREIFLNIEANVSKLNVWADASMLEKIVFNILSNAFKVTPNGGSIIICISAKNKLDILPLINENEPVKTFEISIKDTGPGLEKDQIEKIFERFYQVDNLNRSYYGGTGIGLEVVRSFVELHKGRVEVESEIGQGTIFRVILPSGKKHYTEGELVSTASISKIIRRDPILYRPVNENISDEQGRLDMDLQTVLVVEDNIELINYLKTELSDQYKVLTATNGKKGLEIAKKALPDIIITDVIMPEMDGFELCVQVKNDIRISHIPILMLTTKTMADDWVKGIDSGADAYMSKPFNLRILKSRLNQLITNRKLLFNKYFSAISETSTSTQNTTSLDKEFIQKVLSYINDNLSDPELSVEVLASQLNLSRSQFYRKIKSLTGQTANGFLRKIRLQRAKLMIEQGNTNISDVCYTTGFSSPSYFTKCFKKEFDILPTDIKPGVE